MGYLSIFTQADFLPDRLLAMHLLLSPWLNRRISMQSRVSGLKLVM